MSRVSSKMGRNKRRLLSRPKEKEREEIKGIDYLVIPCEVEKPDRIVPLYKTVTGRHEEVLNFYWECPFGCGRRTKNRHSSMTHLGQELGSNGADPSMYCPLFEMANKRSE